MKLATSRAPKEVGKLQKKQQMTFFIFGSLSFQDFIFQALEKFFFTKFIKFNISAFIRTFKCQKIFKISSSKLKKRCCIFGPKMQNMGEKNCLLFKKGSTMVNFHKNSGNFFFRHRMDTKISAFKRKMFELSKNVIHCFLKLSNFFRSSRSC